LLIESPQCVHNVVKAIGDPCGPLLPNSRHSLGNRGGGGLENGRGRRRDRPILALKYLHGLHRDACRNRKQIPSPIASKTCRHWVRLVSEDQSAVLKREEFQRSTSFFVHTRCRRNSAPSKRAAAVDGIRLRPGFTVTFWAWRLHRRTQSALMPQEPKETACPTKRVANSRRRHSILKTKDRLLTLS
jgi:hypothetical protein